MKKFVITLVSVALLALGLTVAQQQFLTLGTASVVGIYYPVGGATAQIINQAGVGLRVTVEATGGSAFNARALAAGELDLAIAQSDVVFQAHSGTGAFEGEAVEGLRTIMGLHPEPLHLVCHADTNVETIRDLEGLRVNIGNPGSGIRFTVEQTLEAIDMPLDSFSVEGVAAAESIDFLRDRRVDCIFYTIGVGGAALQDIATTLDVTFVPLDDEAFEALVDEYPYYSFTTIPAATYRGQDEDITVFGVRALFVTTDALDEETVYNLTTAILENVETFRATHPALRLLGAQDFVSGLSAPLHPGAERAYEEAGIVLGN